MNPNLTKAEAIAIATKGGGVWYDGELSPALGEALWDPEGGWVVRVRAEDIPFPCGEECCGIAQYAVVLVAWAFKDGKLMREEKIRART